MTARSSDSLYRDASPRMERPVLPHRELCETCGHVVHPEMKIEMGSMGPRTHVGSRCLGCPACNEPTWGRI